MTDFVAVSKNETEGPVPSAWRATLAAVVGAMRSGNLQVEGLAGVDPLSPSEAARISGNIEAYGARLDSLPEAAWETSVYIWMRGWWDVLVDLFTLEEGRSDLALFVRVREEGPSYHFEIYSLHVP